MELNKKLIGFAGIFVNNVNEEHWIGLSPENKVVHLEPFTESLDACFKWLVPKLRYANIQFSDQYSDVIPQFSATVSIQFADNHTWADNNPALALCLAIEKLIDSEVKHVARYCNE